MYTEEACKTRPKNSIRSLSQSMLFTSSLFMSAWFLCSLLPSVWWFTCSLFLSVGSSRHKHPEILETSDLRWVGHCPPITEDVGQVTFPVWL